MRSQISTLLVSITAMSCLLFGTGRAHGQVCPGDEGCLVVHEAGGCSDEACCQSVCQADPFCCEEWDSNCVELADATCVGLCGAMASGGCFVGGATPSCDDVECCQTVCVIDPFCCETAWDVSCAFLAGSLCSTGGGECGDPDSGPCDQPGSTPACEDEECCEVVCVSDPTCCEVVWDFVCAALGETLCGGTCVVVLDGNDQVEAEGCGTETNDPCDGGTPETIVAGRQFGGTFRLGGDVDVYDLDLTGFDEDLDGEVRLRITMGAADAMLAVRGVGCDLDPIATVASTGCQNSTLITCVPAIPTEFVVTPGPTASGCEEPVYAIRIEVIDFCGEPCDNPADCLVPHESPGCEDPTCCDLVCKIDPLCCEWTWDSFCTVSAATNCGGDPPPNDLCDDAIEIGPEGIPSFRQLLAGVDGPDSDCVEPALRGGDVWFRHRVVCDGELLVGTCNFSDFNTLVDVYRGDCTDLVPVACNDDDGFCSLGSSVALVPDAVCGETLWIRISGVDGGTGTAGIQISCFGGDCPCTGDLNGDGIVDGADFGLLLSGFGSCPKKGDCPGDLDGNGVVDGADIGLLLATWGDC